MILDAQVIGAAERAEADMHLRGNVGVRPRDWIGEDATFAEVMLFDWARLRAEARRAGQSDIEAHADAEVKSRMVRK